MPKKAAFITVHGMGRTDLNYNQEIVQKLKRRLGSLSDNIYMGKVYYQDILQSNEDRVWHSVDRQLKWDELRKFLLFGFADATGLESNKDRNGSDYWKAQVTIAKELLKARDAMEGDGPVVFLAQSLGCEVISCYFWDANQTTPDKLPTTGIWQNISDAAADITGGRNLKEEEVAFLRGSHFRVFITTGCNIPIFVAAHAKDDILPIHPNNSFEWHNYYDKDDVLGWPLAVLSDQYGKVVVDHPINVGGGMMGWLLKSWNPLSHTQYWVDDGVLDPLEQKLRTLLS
ncbi:MULTISPECIES: hypothetical protein [unclassified Nitrosomonas]|uniref:hypothetical protein n=1 Tax=unclassified Nitrosomonas TaxID=2609265 RepID=UPI00089D6089|nr:MULTISPECIES: hypothetical protein [unclassified Nitrosomonas]MDV6345315.1 hypothetical protein [Nitrosomonas sp. Is37]SDY36818.1 hypothetical protein SAMN05421755_101828 [Nitrosomonas sp. Nm33]